MLASLISRDYFEINDYIDRDIIENYENKAIIEQSTI